MQNSLTLNLSSFLIGIMVYIINKERNGIKIQPKD